MISTKEGGGSFRSLRDRNLAMFDEKLHRHDRGWPHPPEEEQKKPPKRRWVTVGIFRFPHDEEEGCE